MGTLVVEVADNVAGIYVIDLAHEDTLAILNQASATQFPTPAIIPLKITLADFVGDDDRDGVCNGVDPCPIDVTKSEMDGEPNAPKPQVPSRSQKSSPLPTQVDVSLQLSAETLQDDPSVHVPWLGWPQSSNATLPLLGGSMKPSEEA